MILWFFEVVNSSKLLAKTCWVPINGIAAEDTMKGSADALLLSRHCPAQLMATSSSMTKDGLAGKSCPQLHHVLYLEISGNKTNSATSLPIKFAFQLRMWWYITKILLRRICFQLSASFSEGKMSLSNTHVYSQIILPCSVLFLYLV